MKAVADPSAWAAIGSEWIDLGYIEDDGLVIIDDLPQTGPPFQWPVTITLTAVSSTFGWWRLYRDLIGITHPSASRVKREYHRRRR